MVFDEKEKHYSKPAFLLELLGFIQLIL